MLLIFVCANVRLVVVTRFKSIEKNNLNLIVQFDVVDILVFEIKEVRQVKCV